MSALLLSALIGLATPAREPASPPVEHGAPIDPASTELLDDALLELAQQSLEEALALKAQGNYLAALNALRGAYEISPDDPDVTYQLGLITHLLGNYDGAERYYRLTLQRDPTYIDVHLSLADLALDRDDPPAALQEVAQRLALARDLAGDDLEVMLRQARVASRLQRGDEADRFYREVLSLGEPDDAIRIELGDHHRDRDDAEEALRWYRQVGSSSARFEEARERIWQLEVDLQARRFGWTPQGPAASPQVRTLTTQARRLFQQQRLKEAERALRQALELAPQHTDARGLLGDVLRAAGQRERAELEYLRGLAFNQGSAELHARLGELYLEGDEARRAAEAVVLLSRALQLRPDWAELHLSLARALRLSGDLPRALRSVRTYLAATPEETKRDEALALEQTLDRLLAREGSAAVAVLPDGRAPQRGKRELIDKLNRARAHLARGDTGAAVAELRMLPEAERSAEVRKLEARILHAAGQLDEAIAAFRSSLRLDPDQADAHQQLGVVLASQGQMLSARRHLLEAERRGSLEASFHLARVDVNAAGDGLFSSLSNLPQLLSARGRLRRVLEQSTAPLYVAPARTLRAQVNARLRDLTLASLVAAIALVAGLALAIRWRWGGVDLKRLLSDAPESGPEVQRVISAIRHEVLKHNTLVLSGLVEAIEDDRDAAAKASHLLRSLFGAAGEEAVVHRFLGYVAELEQLGRAQGLRLNLRRADPALSPIFMGFDALARLRDKLERLAQLNPKQRRELVAQLKHASELLNTRAYQAVQRLLTELSVLSIDEALIQGVFQRTCREPALAEVPVEPLELQLEVELPCAVSMPRGAFEDILSNLIRNAIQSSLRESLSPVPVGLALRSEVNPITGHERLHFAVRDRSPQPLTTEMLHAQRSGSGLGLTASLLAKFGGALAVEEAPDQWAKEVVAKLPRAELTRDEASP